MPGYLISGDNQNASEIPLVPAGNLEANNIQDAIEELDSEKSSIHSPNFTGTASAAAAAITGNFIVDTNTLYVDPTNDYVGIKTSTPSSELDIYSGDGTSRINFSGSLGRETYIEAFEHDNLIFSADETNDGTESYQSFRVDGSEQINIRSSRTKFNNNVSIGSEPVTDAALYVSGEDGIKCNRHIQSGYGSGGVALTINDGYGNANLTFNHLEGVPEQNGNAGRIEVNTDSSTNATMYFEVKSGVTEGVGVVITAPAYVKEDGMYASAYNSTSDYRAKENVADLSNCTEIIQSLYPKSFNFIEDGKSSVGFIAHEAETVIPFAVNGKKDAVDENGEPIYQGVDYSKVVPVLVGALQEAIERIEELEKQINT